MKPIRQQHIVSAMLLSQFADPDGLLWVYARGKDPRCGKPNKECRERDFYEYEVRGRKTNNRFENWLAQIESDAAPLIQSICNRHAIERRDAIIWATFVAALFGRTRKVRSQVSATMRATLQRKADDPSFIREYQHTLLQKGELRYADDLKHALARWANESDSYFHVSALPNRIQILAPSLLEREWHTLEAADGQYFLISDCPVLTVECSAGQPRFGVGFGNKDAAILLPMSPRHLFVASPHHVGWKAQLDSAGVECINREIVHFAHRNVYANIESESIREMVDAEIDQVVFGKNAFVPPSKPSGQES